MNWTVHAIQNSVHRQTMLQYFSGSHIQDGVFKITFSLFFSQLQTIYNLTLVYLAYWYWPQTYSALLLHLVLSNQQNGSDIWIYIIAFQQTKFVITEFLDLQQCHSRKSSEEEFKALINSIISSKINSENMKNAKKFAESMVKCDFDALKSVEFVNFFFIGSS